MDRVLAKIFGGVLRDLREAKELSQEDLALECELDRTFISMLERGIRQPTISTIFSLSRKLGLRPSDFIARVERKQGK